MAQEGRVLIETHETYPKQTNRNRTVILTANGPSTLSVPVVRPNGTHTITADIGISYAERWNVIHWRSIEAAYNSSPFFLYYRDGIEKLLMTKYEKLLELNEALMDYLIAKMKLDISIGYTEHFIQQEETGKDYRNLFSYKHHTPETKTEEYTQVFCDRQPFCGNVGILDLLFNLGPETKKYLLNLNCQLS